MEADIGNGTLSKTAPFKYGDLIAEFIGNAQAVLTAERTALNFVQRLSGIATLTRQFVQRIEGLSCKICDTRKTTPMLRILKSARFSTGRIQSPSLPV